MTYVLVLCPAMWYGLCLREIRVPFPTREQCTEVRDAVNRAPEKPARVYCISQKPIEYDA